MIKLKKSILITLLVLQSTQVTAQDFDKGVEAHKSGDYITAFKEWLPLAKQGNYTLQYNIGIMLKTGQGVQVDVTQSKKWLELSAEQGYAPAQKSLGDIFLFGRGVVNDYSKATKWYRLAAEQNHASAQKSLGANYEYGLGVPQNNEKAYMWYVIALLNGNQTAGEYLGQIKVSMTAEEISKAIYNARVCMNSDYELCE